MADEKLSNELPDALIDAHLGLAYKSSGLNGMTGESWDRIVARRFFALGMATAAGIIEFPRREPCREHRDLMLTAAADLESWMKSHGKDLATQETVALLRDAACGVPASELTPEEFAREGANLEAEVRAIRDGVQERQPQPEKGQQ